MKSPALINGMHMHLLRHKHSHVLPQAQSVTSMPQSRYSAAPSQRSGHHQKYATDGPRPYRCVCLCHKQH
eukprot:1161288-Pelagomonas_calceolata.AAC.2